MWECCSKMMLAGVFFRTHPRNPRIPRNPQIPRNPRKWCHEVRFRCLLPRTPVGQDDGSLSKLPQMTNSQPCTAQQPEHTVRSSLVGVANHLAWAFVSFTYTWCRMLVHASGAAQPQDLASPQASPWSPRNE